MGKILKSAGLLILIYLVYLLAWPIPIDPVAWQAPVDKGYVGDFEKNEKLAALK